MADVRTIDGWSAAAVRLRSWSWRSLALTAGASGAAIRRRPQLAGCGAAGGRDVGTGLAQTLAPIDVHGGYVAAGTGHAQPRLRIDPRRRRPVRRDGGTGLPLLDGRRDFGADPGTVVPERQGRRHPDHGHARRHGGGHVRSGAAHHGSATAPTSRALVHGNGDYRLSSFRTRRQETASTRSSVRLSTPMARRRVARRRLRASRTYPSTRVVLADGHATAGDSAAATRCRGASPPPNPVPEVRHHLHRRRRSDPTGPDVRTFNGFAQPKVDWDGSDPQTAAVVLATATSGTPTP